MSKMILCNPPAGSVWHLPSGVAYLAGYLASRGHTVAQRYAHISAVEWVLTKANPEAAWALQAVRDENSDLQTLVSANRLIEETSAAAKTPDHFRVQRNNVKYISQYFDGTIEQALEAIRNRREHLWHDYFAEVELPFALAETPDIYGISIADEHQLIPGLILASMVKESLPKTAVVLGGNYWARASSAFADANFVEVFRACCHSITFAEGYKPLEKMVSGTNPCQVDGAVWLDSDHLVVNPRTKNPIDFESLSTPVFETTTRQWLPSFTPTLYTASNCNRRCGFCSISAGSDTYHQCPRRMSAQNIAKDIKVLHAEFVDFGDESLPIDLQLALGQELRKLGYAAKWCCYLTVEPSLLDTAVCSALHDAGCRIVQLGVESFSKETLRGEHKGWNRPETYGRIIQNLSEAGIHVHVFLIAAIPGEPLSNSLELIRFLDEYGNWITTIKTGRYRLARECPDEKTGQHSKYFEVTPDQWPLHLNRHVQYKQVSNKQVWAITNLLEQVCRQHWAYGITSLIHWCDRMRYPIEQLRTLAKHLPANVCATPDLDETLTKMESIIRKELDLEVHFDSYEDVRQFVLNR